MMRTHLRDELELLLRIGALDEDELREANARGHEASFVRGSGVAGARRNHSKYAFRSIGRDRRRLASLAWSEH